MRLLIEAGANKDQGLTDDGATPLFIAAANGHLEVVQILLESGANKDQGLTDVIVGATPLFIAAQKGHLEVVQFLVESAGLHQKLDNFKVPICSCFPCQQRPRHDRCWSSTSFHSSSEWASWSRPFSGGVRCQQRPRHDRWWINASLHSSCKRAPWSCPISGWVRCQQRPRQLSNNNLNLQFLGSA